MSNDPKVIYLIIRLPTIKTEGNPTPSLSKITLYELLIRLVRFNKPRTYSIVRSRYYRLDNWITVSEEAFMYYRSCSS